MLLAQGLIEDNTCGHGQIQTPDIRVGHGDSIASLGVLVQKIFRQALRLLAEDQIISKIKGGLGVGTPGFLAEQEHPLDGVRLDEGGKAWPMDNRHMLPVVEPRPLQVAIIGAKA